VHRFRSTASAFQLWLGSLLLVACLLGFLASLALFAWTLVAREHRLLWISLWMLGLTILSGIIHLVMALRVRCPLCLGKLLASPQCVRHRRAQTSLGSYRLGVAKGVLTSGRFRCPYCGEPCECASRDDHPGSGSRR